MNMSESQNRSTLEALVGALNAGDRAALDRVFAEDVVIEWPQSRERIVGAHNRREVYSRFPALPHVTPRRIREADDLWTIEASLDYGDGDPYQCVFIFEMRDGLIAKRPAIGPNRFQRPIGARPGVSGWRSQTQAARPLSHRNGGCRSPITSLNYESRSNQLATINQCLAPDSSPDHYGTIFPLIAVRLGCFTGSNPIQRKFSAGNATRSNACGDCGRCWIAWILIGISPSRPNGSKKSGVTVRK
jgi:ketosteroid isomerase-like protein